jgi:hypothetical protein
MEGCVRNIQGIDGANSTACVIGSDRYAFTRLDVPGVFNLSFVCPVIGMTIIWRLAVSRLIRAPA